MSTARNRNLLIIIAVLVLTNIAVLVYFLGPRKTEKSASATNETGKNGLAEMLQKDVGFNDVQAARFKEMREKQREKIRPMYDEMRKSKDSLFRLLSYPGTSDSVLTRLAEVIAQKQKVIDLETFHHFKRVRALCTPDQETKYDTMVLRMFRKMGKPVRHNEAEKKK